MANNRKLMTDEQLFSSVAGGDKIAFEELVKRYLSSLLKFATRYTQNSVSSEDIVQEAFMRVLNSAGSWQKEKGTAKSWLFKVVYNLSMDYLRKQSKQEQTAQNGLLAVSVDSSLEQAAIKSDEQTQLHAALFKLPERQRTALTLVLMNGLSGQEAATVLDLSKEAFDSIMARARRNLIGKIRGPAEIKKAGNQ